jgi:hypothetical protein
LVEGKFGLTPFISVTARRPRPERAASVRRRHARRLLTRYVDASLSLAVASDSMSDSGSFYLVYVNRSRANAPEGRSRSFVVRSSAAPCPGSLEENLKNVKRRLEEN